jgi:DMSO/TMAO reductase YedYZ heme-binding membrane subunit
MEVVGFLLEHPIRDLTAWFAITGGAALALSLPLAVTSTRRMVRRLGGRAWRRLHRLTYPIAIASAAHLWVIPQDGGPGGNIAITVIVALAFVLRLPPVRGAITGARRRRGGSLLAARSRVGTPGSSPAALHERPRIAMAGGVDG